MRFRQPDSTMHQVNIAPEILKSYGIALAATLYREILNSVTQDLASDPELRPVLLENPGASSARGITVGSEVHNVWLPASLTAISGLTRSEGVFMSASRSPDKLSGMSKSAKAREALNPTVLNLKVLDDLAIQLDPKAIQSERKLRKELEAVEGRFWMDRCEMGRILASYRELYNPKEGWYVFCKAVGLNERSALRLIAGYTAAKALPQSIRDAANSRGIDIAAMKNRPLLDKLIELGFEDGAKADDLIQRGLDELEAKKKSKTSARSLSPDQRHQKLYDFFLKLYPDDASASYLIGLDELYAALISRYKGRARDEFLVDGQTNFGYERESVEVSISSGFLKSDEFDLSSG
jgi:hypothetical protein